MLKKIEEPTIYPFSRVNDYSRILCLSHNSYPHVLEEENLKMHSGLKKKIRKEQ